MSRKRYEEEVEVTKAEMLEMVRYLRNKYFLLKEDIAAKEKEAMQFSADDKRRSYLLGMVVIMETEAETVSRRCIAQIRIAWFAVR